MDDNTHIVTPDEGQLARILEGTVHEWAGGLDFPRYAQVQRAVLGSPESAGRFRFRALVDERRQVLCSLKAYRLAALWGGRAIPALGIGAVYTPPALRGRGFASALVRAVLDEERQGGARAALLFSDIGAAFYRRLGFARVPTSVVDVPVGALPEAPGARDIGFAELDQAAQVLAARPVGDAFAVARTVPTVRLLVARLSRTIEAHGVPTGPVGALAPRGAALWVGFPGRGLTLLDLYAEDDASRAALLARARAAAERLQCAKVSAWTVAGAAPFEGTRTRKTAVAMIAGIGADGPRRALLTGLDHF